MTPQELRERMAQLPEPPTDARPPYNDHWRHELWRHVAQGDDPFGFLGWPCIYHYVLNNHWTEVIEHEWQVIQKVGPFPFMLPLLSPPQFYPRDIHPGAGIADNLPASRTLIHQTYHIMQWAKTTKQNIADLSSIVEFGGGYGAMALVCRRLGFRGSYTILDVPEFALLQEFFLSNLGIGGILHFTPDKYLSLPTQDHLWKERRDDLFMAGYSLSEIPFPDRDEVLRAWPATSYLFWYNDFEDYQNDVYFQEYLPKMLPEYQWRHWRIEHMPPTNWYTIGWKE